MFTRKQFLALTCLGVDDFVSRVRRNQLPLIHSSVEKYSIRDALLAMICLQFSGAMGLSNQRAASIVREIDNELEAVGSDLIEPRLDKPEKVVFAGRITTTPSARVGTNAADVGVGKLIHFCGRQKELSKHFGDTAVIIAGCQIVNLTNIAHELRRRCNENGIAYSDFMGAELKV